MILIQEKVHEAQYIQAKNRWRKWMRVVSWIIGGMLCIVIPLMVKQNYTLLHHIANLNHEMEQHQVELQEVMNWKSAVEDYQSSLKQAEASQHLANTLYERLNDFKHVSLRLLRVRPAYLYCMIGNVSEPALISYQHFMQNMKYRLIKKQEIEKLWLLEFKIDENKKYDSAHGTV